MSALAHGMKLHNEAMRRLEETAVAHDQWLREHEQSMARLDENLKEGMVAHDQWLREHEQAMARLDEKLDRIAELIRKGRSENGSQ